MVFWLYVFHSDKEICKTLQKGRKKMICHKASQPICKESNFHCFRFTCKIVHTALIIPPDSHPSISWGQEYSSHISRTNSFLRHMFWSNRFRYLYLWTVSLCVSYHLVFFHCKGIVRSIKVAQIGFCSVSVLE